MRRADRRAGAAPLAMLASLAVAVPVLADAPDNQSVASGLETVRVDEQLDQVIPLDLVFRDEEGQDVVLGDFFTEGRPVLLTLGYYECPMLCNLVLNGVIDSLTDLPFHPGDEFELVTVSIDPEEGPELAKAKKERYVEVYGRSGAAEGWHFLTGDEPEIATLADAVGFRYHKVEGKEDYAHPAVIFVITPDGRAARYLYGVRYSPKTLRLSLVEAAAGKVGSTIDRVLLYCFHYDAASGTYVPAALNLMRAAGALTLLFLGLLLFYLWRRESRRSSGEPSSAPIA